MLFHENVKVTPTRFRTLIKHTGDEILVFYDGCTPDSVISMRPGMEVEIEVSVEINTTFPVIQTCRFITKAGP